IWSSRSDGIKIMRRMRQHATLTFGHLIFGGIGVRNNASTSRTYAVVDARDGILDLFHIQNVLTHELHTPEQTHTSVFLLGRRAVRQSVPTFDAIFAASYANILRVFWTVSDSWHTSELLPAHQLVSDAAIVFMDNLAGVSPGEDQRSVALFASSSSTKSAMSEPQLPALSATAPRSGLNGESQPAPAASAALTSNEDSGDIYSQHVPLSQIGRIGIEGLTPAPRPSMSDDSKADLNLLAKLPRPQSSALRIAAFDTLGSTGYFCAVYMPLPHSLQFLSFFSF
ncbi:unnamed protein product, partial [Tilletia controversa]